MMNSGISRTLSAATLVIVGACAALGQPLNSGPLTIEQLRGLASDRSARVDTLWVSYEVFQDPASYSPTGQITHLFRNVLVDSTTGRFTMDRSIEFEGAESSDDGRAAVQSMTLTYDGEIQSAFLPEHMIANVREGADANGLVESGIWGVMLLSEPQPGGLGIDDGSLESLLAHGIVREQLERVGDVPCHVVDGVREGVRYATVWLDVERDLFPMKLVGYGSDGEASSTVTVDSLFFLDDEQLWLPESWQTEIRVRGEVLRTYAVVDREAVAINPLTSDEDFEPHFPPGTIVTDEASDLVYRVSDSGDIREILFERTDGQWVGVAPATGAPNGAQGDSSPPAPIVETLAELLDIARRSAGGSPGAAARNLGRSQQLAPIVDSPAEGRSSPAVPGSVTSRPDRETQAMPTSQEVALENCGLDSQEALRSRPEDTRVDVSQDGPAEPPALGDAGNSATRPARSVLPWIVGAVSFVAVLVIVYGARNRSPA